MRNRYIVPLMMVLMSICLMCVGFSSWTIVYNDTSDVIGSFETDDTVYYTEYIDGIKTLKPLQYTKTSFVGEVNEYDVKFTDYIEVNIPVNIKKCREQLGGEELTKISLKLELVYTDEHKQATSTVEESLSKEFFHRITPQVVILEEKQGVSISATQISYDDHFELLVTISGIDNIPTDNTYEFNVKYNFDLANKDNPRVSDYFSNIEESPLWTRSQPIFDVTAVLQLI